MQVQPLSGPVAPPARGRFTLVELMIVVAIIAVLAAIAVPLLASAQLRARMAEAPPTTLALGDAATAYWLEHDGQTQACTGCRNAYWGVEWPRDRESLDKQAVPWAGAPAYFDIGWAPDGDVRCSYGYLPGLVGGPSGRLVGSEAAATCDLDDDNEVLTLYLVHAVGTGGDPLKGQWMCFEPAGGIRTMRDADTCW